ncbi:hypothetical protein HY213_02860 [Candidatus Peregrinibacteria bacterium]|nr:hypothetical protein [Candidatus Peregrinibacteria bacterium]
MPYRNLEPISKQLTIVIGLTVVGFMTFGLALSFYRNVLFEETLQNIGAQNQKLKENIVGSQQDLEYYRSAQYKDKYAKENLGKINPGENVLIISQNDQAPALTTGDALSPTEEQQAAYEQRLRQMPTIQHWNLYLFHRDKLEELRRGL